MKMDEPGKLNMFESGDVIKCIDVSRKYGKICDKLLTYGNIYKVRKVFRGVVTIVNDGGVSDDFFHKRFELDITSRRKNKINDILS